MESFTPDAPTSTGFFCYRRRVHDNICNTDAWTGGKTFEIYPDLISQTIVPSPIDLTICEGTSVSATFTGGSGGFPGAYTDLYDYSTTSGFDWNPYTPGQEMSSTGLSGTNVFQIRTRRRANGVEGCTWGDPVTISWTITALPDPPVGAAAQNFCAIATPILADIVVTGTAIQWYAASTGGSPLDASTPLVTGTPYYASQTVDGCESDTRLAVTVTVADPAAPTGNTAQTFCAINNPTVASLAVTGTDIIWYDAPSAGNVLPTSTALVNGTTYYVSQTIAGCESDTRLAVNVTIADPTPPTGNAAQSFCAISTPTLSDIDVTATGTVIWYDASTAGNVIPTDDCFGKRNNVLCLPDNRNLRK